MRSKLPKVESFSDLGSAIKDRNIEQAAVLLKSNCFVECANLLDGIEPVRLSNHPDSHLFAYSFYRRALQHQYSDAREQAINDLEMAKKFSNLSDSLMKLFNSRLTVIRKHSAPDVINYDGYIADQFNDSKIDFLAEFRRRCGLHQPRHRLNIQNICDYSCVGVYRWEGDINRSEVLSKLIRSCKAGEQGTLPLFAKLMADNFFCTPKLKNWLKMIDYLVPVPSSQFRAANRGVEITTVLADHLESRLRIPCCHDFLRRKGDNIRARDATLEQVTAQYIHNKRMRMVAKGRIILLIDDVVTKGKTARVCAKRLKELGCGRVFLLVVAQVESTDKSRA